MNKQETELQASEVQLIYRSRVPTANRVQIKTSQDAFKVFWAHWDPQVIEHIEEFKMLLLSTKHTVLGIATISKGGTAGTVIDAKVIFQYALKAHASALVFCHNHPSNNPTPSEADVSITKRLQDAGNLLEIKVLDHIILCGDGTYYSLMDECRM